MSNPLTAKLFGVFAEYPDGVVAAHGGGIAGAAAPRYFASARQAMSRRQKPLGQSIKPTEV